MIFPSNRVRILVATNPVDFRKGHDGLSALVQSVLRKDPFTGTVFVFRSKRADRLKLLYWDLTRPRRERRTGVKLYEQLVLEGYTGSYSTVQRFVRGLKRDGLGTNDAFIPLQFQAGDALQFDWSEEHVVLGGIAQKVKVAHFRLCHSRKPFVVAYPGEPQEMVLDAFVRALAFYGGVPRRVIIDNPKTMVTYVSRSKDRIFHPRFLALVNHYVMEPVACTPASGWEKGQVENQVQFLRGRLFTPKLVFDDLESLNAWLYLRCKELGSRPHPEQWDQTVNAVFADEQAELRPLGRPFDGYVEKTVRVRSTCLVQYDSNRYSVPSRFAGQRVSLRAYAGRIKVVAGQDVITEHKRRFTRNVSYFEPWHYVPLLERKPGNLRRRIGVFSRLQRTLLPVRATLVDAVCPYVTSLSASMTENHRSNSLGIMNLIRRDML